MLAKAMLDPILQNEALTRGLADPEARVLVEWLVERAEQIADEVGHAQDSISQQVQRLCQRGRSIGRFVALWCHHAQRGAAIQLAAVERFNWPLPTTATIDPCELMQFIVQCETDCQAV